VALVLHKRVSLKSNDVQMSISLISAQSAISNFFSLKDLWRWRSGDVYRRDGLGVYSHKSAHRRLESYLNIVVSSH
jgi:hypothetical protein